MKKLRRKSVLLLITVLLLIGVWFLAASGNVDAGQQEAGRKHLEDALRRAAVACYAAEGIYPPTVDYLQEHYGIQIDRQRYYVFYEVFAENVMPQITVVSAR